MNFRIRERNGAFGQTARVGEEGRGSAARPKKRSGAADLEIQQGSLKRGSQVLPCLAAESFKEKPKPVSLGDEWPFGPQSQDDFLIYAQGFFVEIREPVKGLILGACVGIPFRQMKTEGRFAVPLTRLIHENLSTVMCFAYSRKPLTGLIEARFQGEWKHLNKALFEVSAERAEKACLELALFLRMLDDQEKISDYHAATKNVQNCGRLIMKDGTEKILTFREVANKVIHSSRLEWEFVRNPDPTLICHGSDEERWIRAEVDIVAVAAVCGQLMS